MTVSWDLKKEQPQEIPQGEHLKQKEHEVTPWAGNKFCGV